jgi:hypothetical protein
MQSSLSISDLRERFPVSLAGDPHSASTHKGPSDAALHHVRLRKASDGSFHRPSRRVLRALCSDEMLLLEAVWRGDDAHWGSEPSHT